MKKFIIIALFSTLYITKSIEIPALDSINLTNRIELIDISYDDYTSNLDTLKYYVAVYKDSNQKNVYLLKKERSNSIFIYLQDSTIFYDIENVDFTKDWNRGRAYLQTITQLIYTLEYKKVFLFRDLTEGEVKTSTIYNSQIRDVKFKVDIQLNNNYYVSNSFDISFENNTIDFLFEKIDETGTKIIPRLEQIISPSNEDSVFKKLDEFYFKDRFKFKEHINVKKRKELAPDIKKGQKLKSNILLKGINKADSKIEDLFEGNDYLVLYSWGVWCGYCLRNHKYVDSLYLSNYPNVSFASINCESVSENNKKIKKYVSLNKINYPVYQSCEFLKANGIYSYPQLTIIDKDLNVVDFITGNVLKYSEYEDFLKKNNLIE